MKFLNFLGLFLISSGAYSGEVDYKIILNEGHEYINFYAVNQTDRNISVEDFFCLSLPSKVSFNIVHNDEIKLARIAAVNDKCALNKFVELQPYGILGRQIHIETLLSLYGYPSGNVTISAVVCSGRDNKDCKETNKLTIEQ